MPKHSRQTRSSKANDRGSSKNSKSKNSAKRRKTAVDSDEESHVNNFFEILQQSTANSVSIKLAIQEWKETINDLDNTKPMAELINFILESCGCQGKITPNIFEERDDINEILTELQNDNAAGLTDYPIISKQKQFTGNGNSRNVNTFIGKLRRFWRDWIKEMQYEIMNTDDNWIFDNLKVWIVSMSSSNFRPFRHTSTVIGLSLGIELCSVANSIQSELTIAERQINKEQSKKKSSTRSRSQREVQLEKKIEELQAKKERLNTHIDDFFVGLFIHRYRDSIDIIRIECANNIRFWIKEYPIYFLNDNYTRYIGWFLSDKSERVRLYALHGFITILSLGEEWMSMFMSFIERFKSRIFEMAKREVNKVVQNLAIITISEIGKLGLLDEEDYEDIIPLIFLSESKECKHLFNNICSNVLNDLVNKENEEEEEEEEEEIDKDNDDYQQKQKLKNMKKLKIIIQLLVKYGAMAGNEIGYCNKVISLNKNNTETLNAFYDEIDDWFNDSLKEKINEFSYEAYENAINILWDVTDVVKDYNSALQYLSLDLSDEEIKNKNLSLTEEEEICLIWIVKSSILNSIANMKKQNTSNNKKNKEEEDVTELENLNREVMKALPHLLNKYNSDFDNRKIDSLLDIIKELNIELYIDLRIPKSFDELFENLNTIYSKTKDSIILNKCASIYSFLIGNNSNLKDENENQEQYDNSSLVNINEIGKRHFSSLLNEIFLKQITSSMDTINEMLNIDTLEENAQIYFESLNYGMKRIICLLKQIDLQQFKDLIPDYSKTFSHAINISETLLKKRNILLKKLDKSNKSSSEVITIDEEGQKNDMDLDNPNGEKTDKRFNEIEHLIQEIIDNSMTGLYLDVNWNGIKLEEIKINEESKKMEQELEGDIANELEKEMEEDDMEKEEDENNKEKGKNEEKDDNDDKEKDKEGEEKDKENEKEGEKEGDKRGDKENKEEDEEEIKEKEIEEKDKEETDSIENNENKKDETVETTNIPKKKSEYELECDKMKEKIENLIIGNQKILNKNNRKYWTWRSRCAAYHKLADIYLLCNSKFDSIITKDYLKIPTYSIQKEMVNVINECLETVFEIILNKAQEEYIEEDCLQRKDYSKLMIYSIIGYHLSALVTPLQKLVLSGIVGLEHASNIFRWIEFANYYVESASETMEDIETSNITDNDISIINNYWNIICQKIIDEILNKYPKSLIENETQNAAKLTKTTSDNQEEIQKATKAATSIIIKVRTVIDKLLDELARQSIIKTYSLFLKYSKEGQNIPTKLFKMLFNAIKSWSNVSTSSAIRKVVLQALVIFLKKCGHVFFTHLPENIAEMPDEEKESIVMKSTSLWSSLGIIGKAYNSFIINNDEKELYNSMIEKEIVEEFKKKFEEINFSPSEDNSLWSTYFEYINILKSGKVIKKKGGNSRKRAYSKTVSRESSAPNSNINSPSVPKSATKRKTPERSAKRKNSGKKSKYYVSDTESDNEISELESDNDNDNESEEGQDEEEQEAIEFSEGSEDEEDDENKESDKDEKEEEEENEEEENEEEENEEEENEEEDNEEEENEEEEEEEENDDDDENSDEESESEKRSSRSRSSRSTRSSSTKKNKNNKRGRSSRSSNQRKRQKK